MNELIDTLRKATDSNLYICDVFSVNHEILLKTLEAYGIRGNTTLH